MRYPDTEAWITIYDLIDDTQVEYAHCRSALRERHYTAITRGRHLVLLAEEKHDAIEQAVRCHVARTTNMKIGAKS